MRLLPVLALVGCSSTPVVGVIGVEHNRLAAIIAVTEDVEVHAKGRCTADDDGETRILARQGPDLLLDLPLAGLRDDTSWTCSVDVDYGNRVKTHEVSLQPENVPIGVGGYTVEGDGGGYTLVTEWDHDRGHPNIRVTLVDPQGRARWYRFTDFEVIAGLDSSVTDNGYVLVGGGPDMPPTWFDPLGDIALQLGEPPTPGAYHHHVEDTEEGLLALTTSTNTRADGSEFSGFGIVLFDSSGGTAWSWDTQQAVDAGTLVPVPGPDPFHANSVSLVDDALGPSAWVSLYGTASLIRIDRETGTITHTLGAGGDFALLDADGSALPDEAWFSGQHDPEFDGDRVLLLDNGLDAGRSRVLELELDLQAATATVTWEWTEEGWFEPLFGDADRLDNGNVLASRGRCWSNCGGVDDLPPKRITDVVEIAPDGSVPWRLVAPDENRGIYRAERIDPCLLWNDPDRC